MKRKYKMMTANEKCGKHRTIEEMAAEILAAQASQNKKQKKEQYDDEDSAGIEYIQDMLDNF